MKAKRLWEFEVQGFGQVKFLEKGPVYRVYVRFHYRGSRAMHSERKFWFPMQHSGGKVPKPNAKAAVCYMQRACAEVDGKPPETYLDGKEKPQP